MGEGTHFHASGIGFGGEPSEPRPNTFSKQGCTGLQGANCGGGTTLVRFLSLTRSERSHAMAGGKTFKRDQKRRKEMARKLKQEEKMRKKLARREEKKEGGGLPDEEELAAAVEPEKL